MKRNNAFYPKHITEKVAMKATPTTDYLGALVGSLVPGSSIANLIGSQYGLLDKNRTDQQSVAKSFIPGVGVARLVNRLKSQVGKEVEDVEKSPKDKDARPVRHALSEILSPGTSLVASTGVGAGIGKLLGNTRRGAAIGALTGGSGILLGSLLAAIKRRRTSQEQIDNDKKTVFKDLLIPGVGAYNKFKRMGRSQGDRDEKGKSSKTENKEPSTKKAYVIGFSKTAEAYGVDPEQLIKAAGFFDSAGKYGSRWLELLQGGNKRVLGKYNKAKKIISGIKDPNLARDMTWHLNGADPGVYKRYYTKLPSGQKKLLFDTKEILKPEVINELDKVFATRLATGVGGAGLAYGAYKGMSS